MRAEIDAKIAAPPGSDSYLAQYKNALTSVMEALSDEKKSQYLQLAKEWRRHGPPPEIQQK
jgi:hypothetical protein